MELMMVHTKENQSDALMKVLSSDSFQRCVAWMGLLRRNKFIPGVLHYGGLPKSYEKGPTNHQVGGPLQHHESPIAFQVVVGIDGAIIGLQL